MIRTDHPPTGSLLLLSTLSIAEAHMCGSRRELPDSGGSSPLYYDALSSGQRNLPNARSSLQQLGVYAKDHLLGVDFRRRIQEKGRRKVVRSAKEQQRAALKWDEIA
ncbi:hypothetical protein DICSQDRAFT_130620 [Dichomitus squalens LYAD-421 SS1]|uniref:Uncharacterized protein n=2 Tax=Dichomitus squalens TaxID=114155 RepID=A0A4Q9PKX6_9APHY|nr:uncharacterized protein DICSQDRAFT_130620 [Dichomitus squalens LYAD-421 SS1]EJF55379.1 hypothetical protein DICSQDRAFT_130620 [Dichomitus squalens LYAD-421 SS1]TBU54756.1 hypothetical protein BD310DRAFT_827398 [Dichomitus squalens]